MSRDGEKGADVVGLVLTSNNPWSAYAVVLHEGADPSTEWKGRPLSKLRTASLGRRA